MSDCYNNTFGNNSFGNIFGNDCHNNTFGNNIGYNSFGDYYRNNTFGNDCFDNSFGNDCHQNTFGNDCFENTFGNYCTNNTFGNNIGDNIFNSNFTHNTIKIDSIYNSIFETLSKLTLTSSTATTEDTPLLNLLIKNGVTGSVVCQVVNQNYQWTIAKDSKGNIIQYCEDDLKDNKVDKVTGKSLISDSEITRLASVTNYDDTTIKANIATNTTNISALQTTVNSANTEILNITNVIGE